DVSMPIDPKFMLAVIPLLAISSSPSVAEPRQIGTAIEIRKSVSATSQGAAKRALARKDPVRELAIIEAGNGARGEFELADSTKLAVGSQGRIILDKFVYDPDKSGGKVSLNLAKGAFRFITGKSSKDNYELKTSHISLGIRGTVFDGYIAADGR